MATDNIARGLSKRNEKVLEKQAQEIVDKAVDIKLNTIETSNIANSLSQAEDGFVTVENIKGKTLVNLSKNNGGATWNTPTNRYLGVGTKGFLGLKARVTYSFILFIENIKLINSNILGVGADLYFVDGSVESITFTNYISQIGTYVGLYTPPKDVVRLQIKGIANNYSEDGLSNRLVISNSMILEGDWTNKEVPRYFEGIKSVGEDENKLDIKIVGENLTGLMEFKNWAMASNLVGHQENWGSYILPVQPNTKYTLQADLTKQNRFEIDEFSSYPTLGQPIRYLYPSGNNTGILTRTITTSPSTKYLFIYCTNDLITYPKKQWDIKVYSGDKIKDEEYKENKIEHSLQESLRSLPNGVCDEIVGDKLIRRVGKVVFDGSFDENWIKDNNVDGSTDYFYIATHNNMNSVLVNSVNNNAIISDSFSRTYSGQNVEGYWSTTVFVLTVAKSKTNIVAEDDKSTRIDKFRSWLSNNPVTFYYQLPAPITTTISLPSIKSFKNGSIYLRNFITPDVKIKYPTNLAGRVFMAEQEYEKASTSVNNYWQTLLILADRELRMKSIQPLTTNTTADIKNKLNEIMNAWK